MRAMVTGANGFIAKNLLVHLREKGIDTVTFTRDMSAAMLGELLDGADFIFHLAGINRAADVVEFTMGNETLTKSLCSAIRGSGRSIPVLYTSSIQVGEDHVYGRTKLAAEEALIELERDTGSPVYIYRLPNVFGKWSRPNYNSVVATFSNNIAKGLPIQINDAGAVVQLAYVDDVIKDFFQSMERCSSGVLRPEISPVYKISVGDLADQIRAFRNVRESLVIESVGDGLIRALYSTYLSFLSPEQFVYSLPINADRRGRFVEILKTKSSGQFSVFTAHPGITRGGHYHHTKNEKFLVVQGKAKFRFRHLITDETFELFAEAEIPKIVESVPGWLHDITNVGDSEMIVILWASEIFDLQHPDTVAIKV